ncbi:MAG: pantetheine-phosphate adenylyltransferase [Nocardioides sp.]|uniref:pantetheine-phosphate adenylyltransferase n=1 Tax=Nocardioides sp. TaxID=35761 RepID=UPI003F08542B
MRRAVCPGTFDPVTNGHLDVVRRASLLFDEVVVAAGVNSAKSGLFTLEERLEMLREVVADLGNVTVDSFGGLVVDYCTSIGAVAMVKGLRGPGDYEYELPMAHMNSRMSPVETVFLATDPAYSFVSSSLMKVVLGNGGQADGLLPPAVVDRVKARYAELAEGGQG